MAPGAIALAWHRAGSRKGNALPDGHLVGRINFRSGCLGVLRATRFLRSMGQISPSLHSPLFNLSLNALQNMHSTKEMKMPRISINDRACALFTSLRQVSTQSRVLILRIVRRAVLSLKEGRSDLR